MKPIFVLLLVSGFGSIHSETELIDGVGTEDSSGDCDTILATVQMSQRQLDKLDDSVRSITPNLKDNIEHRFIKLVEKLEHFIESKFVEVDKKMDRMESKLTTIEDKISQYTSHIDSKIIGLETMVTRALNVSDTLNNKNACCQASLDTSVFVKNLTEMNEAIKTPSDIVVPKLNDKNIPEENYPIESTEAAHNVTYIITTTEVNKPAPSKCDSSLPEECCTAAVVRYGGYKEYTEISTGRHAIVNVTSIGLQEYAMYFAVRGQYVLLLLSPTSPLSDLYYKIGFKNESGGFIYIDECTYTEKRVNKLYISNIISSDQYSYYYVTISGDKLKVGRRGEPPLLTHTSTLLRKLKYFSFACYGTSDAALYDCTAE